MQVGEHAAWRTARGRGLVALVVAVAALAVILVVRDDEPAGRPDVADGGSGSSVRTGSGSNSRDVGAAVGRLLPADLPDGFEPVGFRPAPDDDPVFGGSRAELVLYAATAGSSAPGDDLGVIAVRSPALPGAITFAPDQRPVDAGEAVAYLSEAGPAERPMRRVASDADDGVVIVAASHSLEGDELARIVGHVEVEDGRPRLPRSLLPPDFQEIARGDASFVVFGRPPRTAEGYEVQYVRRGDSPARLVFSRWRDRAPWEPMVRWWFGVEGETVGVGGQRALVVDLASSVGEPERAADDTTTTTEVGADGTAASSESTLVGWREDGVTTIVIGHAITRAEVVRVARTVQVASEAEWSRVVATAGGAVSPSPNAGT